MSSVSETFGNDKIHDNDTSEEIISHRFFTAHGFVQNDMPEEMFALSQAEDESILKIIHIVFNPLLSLLFRMSLFHTRTHQCK